MADNGDPIDSLFVIGYGKNREEKVTMAFAFANLEVAKPDKRVEIILIYEGAPMAVEGRAREIAAAPPFDEMGLEQRMRDFMAQGGVINVSTPCLVFRELGDAPVLDGIVKLEGPEMLAKHDRAGKVMRFT